MFEELEFTIGETARIVTAAGLHFSGPILNRCGELVTIQDVKTGKKICVNLRWIRSIETEASP